MKQKNRILGREYYDHYGAIKKEVIKFSSFEGLESLPLEIRDKTATEIAQYVLDLSVSAVSLYRTKLMVVIFFFFF